MHEVERGVWQRILAMGRQATGRFLQMQGDGDVGETVEMSDGTQLKRLPEPHRRPYASIFGPFTVSRYVYGTREGQRIEFVPLDARLELPDAIRAVVEDAVRHGVQRLTVDPMVARYPWLKDQFRMIAKVDATA